MTRTRTPAEQRAASNRKREAPGDFAKNAATMSQSKLMRHYCASHRMIQRWSKETGAEPKLGARYSRHPIPDDFTTLALVTTKVGLVRHYGVHNHTVARWLRLTQIEPPAWERPRKEKAPRQKATRTSRPAAFRTPKQAHSFDTLRRETTTDGLAADHLRRFCAVYRCNERGRADQDGAWWRYGNAILTPAELIARAERHGFDAQEWRRLAA